MSTHSVDSLSDGEIVSGDEEKAISTTSRSAIDSNVNTSARLPPHGSSSRAAQSNDKSGSDPSRRFRKDEPHVRSSRERSRSPYRRRRSRSRSPYRESRPSSGEKRTREDDHYNRRGVSDPRRFKVHYEGKSSARAPQQGFRRSYADFDQPVQSAGRLAYDEPGYADREVPRRAEGHGGRERSRSRSPYRHQKGDAPSWSHSNGRNGSTDKARELKHTEKRESTPQTTFGQDIAKNKTSTSQLADGFDHTRESIRPQPPESSDATADQQDASQTPLSEAELIEQRRKRREAIKAKHKIAPPLLVQALEQNLTSAPATPIHDTSPESSEQQSPPSSFNSPRTPQRDSPPGSPASFSVNNDEELIDHRPANPIGDEEGPSAADYDPNMDMQEDRPDHKRQDLQESLNGAHTPPPVDQTDEHKPQQKKDFDMFAEDDDDDDMFAPVSAFNKSAPSVKQARALDQSLLDNWDYPDGHYRIILGELLDGKYAVQQQIGKGTFATVVRAKDTRDDSLVAIKIACNNDTMYKAGQKEMDMLELLHQNDPEDKKHIIRLVRHFEHKGHLCLVFENLSADLREVLKKFGRNVGLNLKAIRSYAQQMFLALSHMKKCQILHADLKPDNILVSEKRNLLKICDLGTASFAADAEITPYLVSRFYRAPEVILGMPFDYAIDTWSIGCTLFELYTGRILFAGADNNQMLRSIQECRGKFPLRMLKRSSLLDKHFDATGNFYSQERDKLTGKPTVRQLNFNKTVPGKDLRARLSGNLRGMRAEEIKEHASFVDLMEKCLQLDPARRVTPSEALRHSFIMHGGNLAQIPSEKAKEPVRVAMNFTRTK